MFTQLFGKYLTEKAVIKEDIYKKILEKQKSVRVKLGTIAVAEGMLTTDEAEKINELQKKLDKRFGDIAIEQGFITNEQMEELLSKQGNAYLKFVELLTETTGLTAADAEQLIKAYQKDSGYTDEEMEALKSDDIDKLIPLFIFSTKPHIREIAALVSRNMTRFISTDYYIDKAQHVKDYSYEHLTCQELFGDDSVFIGIAAGRDEESFLKTASAFAREEISSVGGDAYDAIGEFINVTSGLFCSELSKKKIDLDMEPPVSFKKQTARGNFYVIPVFLEGHRLDVVISVNEGFVPGETPEIMEMDINTGVSETNAEGSLGKVMIVDDSRMSRTILRSVLEKAGYSVIREADNGEDAVAAFKECRPDLVTLDITMPKMDGLEALARILAFDADAKIIMITAAGQQDKLITALKQGAKRFINKPFDEEEVLKNVGDVIQGK